MRARDGDSLVLDVHPELADERNGALLQLAAQAFLVSVFQQAGTEVAVNLNGRTDDLPRQFVRGVLGLIYERRPVGFHSALRS